MLQSANARADQYVNPGIKLGYTFGEGGGFTLGGELSMPFLAGALDRVALGAAFNIDYNQGRGLAVRLGPQLTSYIFGVEGGPTLIIHDGHAQFGFAVTPWAPGPFLIPYYTFTTILDGPNWHETGAYLKLPLHCKREREGTDASPRTRCSPFIIL